jgi:hypothetical protein
MNELISVEGVKLPNIPLTDIQIIDAINQLKIHTSEVCSAEMNFHIR